MPVLRKWILPLALALTAAPAVLLGQVTDGNLVGVVLDSSGAAIPGAAVSIENVATGMTREQQGDESGAFRFNNLPVGQYRLTASTAGFQTTTVSGVMVELNQTTTQNLTLPVGQVATEIIVAEAGAALDTTTAQIGEAFDNRQAVYQPSVDLPLGILNLSLQTAGVASSGGVGVGEGPSVGGQRPRNNNFMIEGVDNNAKDVTGRVVDVSNEAVAEFSLLQNQFGVEFGRSTGGQFNTVIKSGTNEVHGSLYEYFQNRHLNAVDVSDTRRGFTENPRYDDNRFGGTVGGPIVKNKLFYFGNVEYNPLGLAASPAAPFLAPTAEGYAQLEQLQTQGVSGTNLSVLQQYLPAAASQTDTTEVLGREIPIGVLPLNVPAYEDNFDWLAAVDYNFSNGDQIRGRYIDNRTDAIDENTVSNLPAFATGRSLRMKLATMSFFHSFSPTLFNETRLGYSRKFDDIPVGEFDYPNLDSFPNIVFEQDLQLDFGPFSNAPQGGTENTYQVVNNSTWMGGRHTIKFGVDARRNINVNSFIQRQRGEYAYTTLEPFLLDLSPDVQAERNTGGVPYYGNNWEFFWYVNDEIKLRRNLTLNLGLRHEYKGVPYSDTLQTLNSIASVPGVLEFDEPEAQLTNFAPRVGLAYSPGAQSRTVIRAGFGLAYDTYFSNLGTLSKPVQLENTVRVAPGQDIPNFLANGGIRADQRPEEFDAETARALTSTYVYDQKLPYSIQWNFGVERVFAEDYTFSARYLGTRGVNLFTQSIINFMPLVTPQRSLPTYLQRPSQAELDSLGLTLEQLDAEFNAGAFLDPTYLDAGFQSAIFAFPNRGNSIYHGLATELKRRFSNGLTFIGAYTWSHNIDDSTADLFSTLLSPRRPQDFYNMRAERGNSFLDHRHRFTFSWVYETPWLRSSSNWFARNVIGNWTFSGLYTYETPQFATVQSGVDSNMNGDAAGDRAIVNPGGDFERGSDVEALTNSAGETVGYLAKDPSARWILAGRGAFPNGGRNVLPLEHINNIDFSLGKQFNITESKRIEFRANLYNALNNPQFIPGSVNSVRAVDSANTRANLIPGNDLFNKPEEVYLSHAREIHLVLRFTF